MRCGKSWGFELGYLNTPTKRHQSDRERIELPDTNQIGPAGSSIVNEVANGPARLTPMGRFVLLAILSTVPVFILFAFLGHPVQGMAVCVCGLTMAIAVRPYWQLRRSAAFRFALAIAVFLQIPFVRFVPWSNRYYRGGALLPFALLDYVLVYGCFKVAQWFIRRADHSDTSG